MRTALLVVLLGGLAFANARAQNPGRLAFYGDEARSQCAVFGGPEGAVDIYMYLVDGTNQNTVFFYAPTPTCWEGAVWTGDAINDAFLHLGSSHDARKGLAITFTQCLDSPIYLGKMGFTTTGTSPCCYYEAYPVEFEGMLGIVDCSLVKREVPFQGVTIDPDDSCACTAGTETPTATETTTWGRVKALYR